MDPDIRDNPARHRYELTVDDATAFVTYRRQDGVITFVHTEVPSSMEGRGIGSRLARHVLDAARQDGLRVVPMCPFIAAWMKKHPEYDDLRVTPAAG
ncbi:MAG: N-acetyltransferase [Rhizobiales bacterium]|nr:N-acetyltransferase [Hyphomicrobiales bacterium]